MSETGYVEGQNVAIEYRLADGQYDRLPAMAADLVGRKVAVIAAVGPAAAQAAKRASATIPIVFLSGDPVAEGLVAGLARPGGNLTGVSMIDVELMAKRLELLSELVPQARVFALLVNPNAATAEAAIRNAQSEARAKGVKLHILKAGDDEDIDAAFTALPQLRAGGLVIDADPFLNNRSARLAVLAMRDRVPAIFGWSIAAWSGGLISYGPSMTAALRQIGIYVGRILKGAQPADLPVQQPVEIELAINLNTAKALGLSVPPVLLAQADELIE